MCLGLQLATAEAMRNNGTDRYKYMTQVGPLLSALMHKAAH